MVAVSYGLQYHHVDNSLARVGGPVRVPEPFSCVAVGRPQSRVVVIWRFLTRSISCLSYGFSGRIQVWYWSVGIRGIRLSQQMKSRLPNK